MDVSTDWSVGAAYTQYDAWFEKGFNDFMGPDLSRLFMEQSLGDNQGDRVDLNWLGAAPQLREWKDEKRPVGFNNFNHTVIAGDFESTVEIDKNAFADGKWRQYEARILEMGSNAHRHRWKLVSDLITTNGLCYDGQAFFSTTHSEGASGVQSNIVTGTGTSIAQIQTDYFKASAAMRGMKDDHGEFWGDIKPDFVLAPPQLEEQFAKLKESTLVSGGDSNVLRGRIDYEIDPRLTDANDWYAFHTTRPMKPFFWLEREEPHPVNLIDPEASSERFFRGRLFYSVEARRKASYGLWQYAVKVSNA
jgi:phage major head subunit gpT-like protein